MSSPQHRQQQPRGGTPQQQQPAADNKITPELLVDALSGHEDGLLSIAERLMTHYDAGYDAMGESIIDAFADVQKLFQHVVEAAHMEGAALERERGEGEWRKRLEGMGVDADGVLYGKAGEGLEGGLDGGGGERDGSGEDPKASRPSQDKPEDHRHEELIDQDVRDVLIDAIKRGQGHRDARRFAECRSLYENACASASALLPVDSDHRGRLQLAVARAESMSADRACAILKYAMDDVLRSGLSLRQGKYPQMDVNERSDCVLSRPNPLRQTPSRGYDAAHSWDAGGTYNPTGGPEQGTVEQSAEEALNSLVEEMKEMLAAPVYDLTPLQGVSEKFWKALGEAQKASAKKEERLEQALAKIKADFLMAREEYEEQLSREREKSDGLKRRVNQLRLARAEPREGQGSQASGEGEGVPVPSTPNRPQSAGASHSSPNSGGGLHSYHFAGMDDTFSGRQRQGGGGFDTQSVVSTASEFAQKAKSLVHLLNCQSGERGKGEPLTEQYAMGGGRTERDDMNDERI